MCLVQPKAESSEELETYDIYLLPPNEDPETCQSWLRMRNRSGRYMLMFEEWVTDGSFIITPRITFEVTPSRLLLWRIAADSLHVKQASDGCLRCVSECLS